MNDVVQFLVIALTNGALYALVAVSINVVYRASGVVNFGVGHLMMFAGIFYANSGTQGGWGPLAATVALGAGLGLLYYVVAVAYGERRGVNHVALALSCLGMGLILNYVAGELWLKQGFRAVALWSGSVVVADVNITNQRIITWILAAVFLAFLLAFIERTMMGRSMEATAHDAELAQVYGVNVLLVGLLTWALAGAAAGLAGAMQGSIASVGRPLALKFTVTGFAAAVVGGLGSVRGAVVGGLLIALAEVFMIRFVTTRYALTMVFMILFVVLAVRPQGVFGYVRGVERA
jgi:branched-chain amino acid transport system permease protein